MRRIEKRGEVNVLCDDYGCSPATKAEAEFFDEITRLRAENASLTAQLQSGESFHAVAVRQRDAAWREVKALKATMTQQCKGFRADVEKLEAEVEVLRADAERWEHARSIACFTEDRDMGPGGWWTVAVHVKRRPAANTIDAAVDAARAAQGDKT